MFDFFKRKNKKKETEQKEETGFTFPFGRKKNLEEDSVEEDINDFDDSVTEKLVLDDAPQFIQNEAANVPVQPVVENLAEPPNEAESLSQEEVEEKEIPEVEEPEEEKEIPEIKEAEEEEEIPEVEEAQEEEEISEVEEEEEEEEISEIEETEEEEEIVKPVKEKGFFSRLKAGLAKTRNSISKNFDRLFKGFSSIDDDFYEELEETLIMADLGLDTTDRIIEQLKDLVKKNHIKEVEECRELVINLIKQQMLVDDSAYDFEEQKTVMLIIGVNGVGKTTSIGKLAAQYKNNGKRVMMCAADTFRAAAIDQLKTWANRAGVEIIAQQEGSDPAAVTFDAVKAAAARGVDILLVDTAGRLHNKKNLMDELAKMKRIIEKEYADAHLETLIVLDGSTGQNALEQARQFSTVTNIDGIILTKLDGTAKGGIAIAIQSELNVPVKYIGVGEQIDDLQRFDPESYVNALFEGMDTRSDIEILISEEDE